MGRPSHLSFCRFREILTCDLVSNNGSAAGTYCSATVEHFIPWQSYYASKSPQLATVNPPQPHASTLFPDLCPHRPIGSTCVLHKVHQVHQVLYLCAPCLLQSPRNPLKSKICLHKLLFWVTGLVVEFPWRQLCCRERQITGRWLLDLESPSRYLFLRLLAKISFEICWVDLKITF